MGDVEQWQQQKGHPTEGFHMDPNKEIDPVEKLVAEIGIEGALADINARLDVNPDDAEARRQATLIISRADDIARNAAALKQRTQH